MSPDERDQKVSGKIPGEKYATITGLFLGNAPGILHDLNVVLDHAENLPMDLRHRLRDARDNLSDVYRRADKLNREG